VAAGLEERARRLGRVPALDPAPPARWPEPTVRYLEAAGHWTLAAEALWPRVLDRPGDRDLGSRLLRVESRRLPLGMRVRLAEALLQHAPGDAALLLELARLYLAVRWVPVAQAVLERLAASPSGPRPAAHWSAVLRDRRAVPAPAPRPTFGFEVGPPRHRLVGDVLRVDDHHPVSLDWFVGYRLVPGFWGPPRQLELVDVWGRRWGMGGEALPLAAALERVAPHLGDLHEVGLVWPGTTGRIRRLHRASAARSAAGAP
jgi:hypothetical protein